MKEILLISPLSETHERYAIQSKKVKVPVFGRKVSMLPISLATISALTPKDLFQVEIWDELIHGKIDDTIKTKSYDLVGISCLSAHLSRAKEIARIFRKRNITVVVGGPGITVAPELYSDDFDVVFAGEAEITWPQFLEHWSSGTHQKEYVQTTKPSLSSSPPPCWDGIETDHYMIGAVQTTRGCPFDCEFCDVAAIYGRTLRHKSISQVLDEILALERLGKRMIFVCDDNFAGDPQYAKDLLKELIPLNNSFRNPPFYSTQMSLNVAKDEKLLELLMQANFRRAFIGVESPNPQSLKEANKVQNVNAEIVSDLKKIMSYGIVVRAGLIVGFDSDDSAIFQQQFELVQEAHIPLTSVYLLHAPMGTKLWHRLCLEKRLIEIDDQYLGFHFLTNIIPNKMSRTELAEGYLHLLDKLYDWQSFTQRMMKMISSTKRHAQVSRKPRFSPKQTKHFFLFLKFLFFDMDKVGRHAAIQILRHTLRQAPFLLEDCIYLIIIHYVERLKLNQVKRALTKQIEDENSGIFPLKILHSNQHRP